jgi:WD40 repeat protein
LRTIRINVGIVVCCLLVAACTQKTQPVGPKFKGRLLFLSGNSATGMNLLELAAGPNDTFNSTSITSGVFEAAASPDQTALIYATKDEILLRDLRTGEVKPLVKGETFCLAWSPDGKRFSYEQRDTGSITLYAAELDGRSRLVWEDVWSAKRKANQASAGANVVSLGCAQWVAPDKLIFDRFGPSQVKGGDVKPNTTTLAIVSDTVKLVDTAKGWSVEGICKTGSAILRSEDGQILIAKSLENPKTASSTSGPCSSCRFLGFAAQSCVPFFIEDSSSTSSEVFYLNPTNWQRQRAAHIGQPFSTTATALINSSARLMVIGDVRGTLVLVDTESGDVTSFFAKSAGPPEGLGESRRPIVWIEK